MKKLVIIPGGFHPFHAGHKALYDAAVAAFPSAEVYMAATADTSTRPFPIELKKKLAKLAGIPVNRFIQVKSPFRAEEITQHYDPNNTVLIFARSEKDVDNQPKAGGVKKDGTPAYLQPYKRNGLQPMSKHGYMIYLPTVQFGPGITSATEIRAKWPTLTPEQKAKLTNQLYPATEGNDQLTGVTVKMLDAVLGQGVEEGMGSKALATAALVGAGVMAKPTVKVPAGGKEPTAISRPASKTNPTIPSGRGALGQAQKPLVPAKDVDEATLINDPDAGHQIVPDGGMGTWDEASLVSNLARKFGSMVEMVKVKNYTGLQYVLYKDRVVKSMVDALAEYERFMQKQGRRPIARGKEVDMSQQPLDEKTRMRMPTESEADYIEEKSP